MTQAAATFVWEPTKAMREQSRLFAFMQRLGVGSLDDLQCYARDNIDDFWLAAMDDVGIQWAQRPRTVHDSSEGIEWTKWWLGGKLNLAYNASTRHGQRTPDKPAVVYESDSGSEEWSFAQLEAEVCRSANVLRKLGVGKGDAVGLCMPMTPECVALFLACSKIGAIVAPLFSGFGAGAIVSRLRDCDAKVLVIADGYTRRGRVVEMKATADEAATELPALQHILVVRRLGTVAVEMEPGRDVWLHDVAAAVSDVAETDDSDANDPMMLIYTSGTTGRPKGTVHVQGGFPLKATQDMAHCFDVRADDRLLWFTDIGWMMGPWAICGALTLGATLVLFDGVPDYPGPDRLWDVVEKHRVSVLGVAPTVVRALMRHGDAPVSQHDLSSLRILGSSGEPWNVDPWMWFLETVGGRRCPIINYSGGTEVSGGIVGGNLLTPLKPCAFAGPCPGMDADVVNDSGEPVRGQVGELVVRSPWPGMTQSFWHDNERYLDTYWSRIPGMWVHGDWAEIDSDGAWFIRGRSDDTIKIAGKRLGPAEVESALVAHPSVAEAAAIGVPDDVKGEALVAFVVVKPGTDVNDQLVAQLGDAIKDVVGKAMGAKAIYVVSELPKTRNAKVLRRVIRAIYLGADPGDLSSLENTSAIDAIRSTASA